MANKFLDEMRIYDGRGNRLYVNTKEREGFLEQAKELDKSSHRLFCEVLHWTGCRISEALELTPRRIDIEAKTILFRTLKKRLKTKEGKIKKPVFRAVPVPTDLIESLDIFYQIRVAHKTQKGLDDYFWPHSQKKNETMTRVTGWNIVKRTLAAANIVGAHANPKGFRHGYGVAMTLAGMDVFILRDRLGHSSAETTQIYRQAIGKENHQLSMSYWEKVKALSQR